MLESGSALMRVKKDTVNGIYIIPATPAIRTLAAAGGATPLSSPLSPPMTPVALAAPGTDGIALSYAQFFSGANLRTDKKTNSNYAALFLPRLKQANMLRDGQVEEFVPCGAVAGIFARTDAQHGVWKAPAGPEATLAGVPQLSVPIIDKENGELNQPGANCLRAFPVYGRVVWGARTLEGADRLASEWKYISVRRTALFLEKGLYCGTQWVVFEPNDEPLWAQIRLNVGTFMHGLFRQGAFQGKMPREAYLIKCDRKTTTQTDINSGIVNVLVGFAPLKPAEFMIIRIQQLAEQIEF